MKSRNDRDGQGVEDSGLVVDGLRVTGLAPVSFSAARGECVAVQGPSGAGKTVLLRAISDLDPADGDVRLAGVSRHRFSGPDWRRRVRYLAAEPGWWEDVPRPHFCNPAKALDRAEALGLDAGSLDRPITQLSTGERQRLALIRALEDQPDVLLLDEPTAALDEKATHAAEALILAELQRGVIILIVTHDQAQASRLTSKKIIIDNGKTRVELA